MNTILSLRGILLSLLVTALLFTASTVYADDDTDTGTSVDASTRVDVRLNFSPEELERRRAEAEERRKAAMEATEAKRAEVRANVDARVLDVRGTADTRRVDVRAEVNARRTEIKARIDTRHDKFEEKTEERQTERRKRREEIAEKLEARAENRIHLHLDRFTTILDAAIERMYGLVERVSERADAMEENGIDVSAAREYLDLAVSELVAAEADLASIEADLDVSLSAEADANTETLRSILSETKTAIESAKVHIRAAHKAVRDAVDALKAAAVANAEAEADASVE